jgi:hypothetical protein
MVKHNVFNNITSVLKILENLENKMSVLHIERYKQQLFQGAI